MQGLIERFTMSACVGALVGIAALAWVKPETPGGIAFIVFVCVLLAIVGRSSYLLIRNSRDSGIAGDAAEKSDSQRPAKHKLLFLGANPADTDEIRTVEEFDEIESGLAEAQALDRYDLVPRFKVRAEQLQNLLMRHRPNFVHISGHGKETGQLIFEDEFGFSDPVSVPTLSDTFRLLEHEIRCVVLNTCYSMEQANAIAAHIEFVVGMNEKVPDETAMTFSKAFYGALAYGHEVPGAFQLACNQLLLESIPGSNIPILISGRED